MPESSKSNEASKSVVRALPLPLSLVSEAGLGRGGDMPFLITSWLANFSKHEDDPSFAARIRHAASELASAFSDAGLFGTVSQVCLKRSFRISQSNTVSHLRSEELIPILFVFPLRPLSWNPNLRFEGHHLPERSPEMPHILTYGAAGVLLVPMINCINLYNPPWCQT